MPLYSYRCAGCGHEFEILARIGETAACPACEGVTLERLVSLVAPEAKTGKVVASARSMAAKEGHFSNFSKAETARIKR